MPSQTHIGCASVAALLLLVASVAAQTHDSVPPAEAALVSRLKTSVDSLARADQFSGVVLLMKGSRAVFQAARGMADREAGRPNTVETAFNLGSINKVFTATAIRQLALQGKLDLDSSLATYWPDYPNSDVARRVTIRQLLEHRSGIGGNIFAAPKGGTRRDLRHNRDHLQLFVHEPLRFEPGASREYSNAGYVVLGMLVERLSGEDYYAYVDRHIYRPAGMTRTAAYPPDSLPPNTAIGYTRGGPGAPSTAPLTRNTEQLPGRGSAAGGGYSTAADLARFLLALREGKIPGGPPAGIGVGGGAPGINAAVEGELPGGYDLIVLTNLDPPAAQNVARLVRGWLGSDDD
jgi:CubicO group peptidase (beta-lactamase class C family)